MPIFDHMLDAAQWCDLNNFVIKKNLKEIFLGELKGISVGFYTDMSVYKGWKAKESNPVERSRGVH